MTKNSLKLEWIPGRFAVVQLPSNAPIPMWVLDVDGFTNITRTKNDARNTTSPAIWTPMVAG
jgi:hypothetical protein